MASELFFSRQSHNWLREGLVVTFHRSKKVYNADVYERFVYVDVRILFVYSARVRSRETWATERVQRQEEIPKPPVHDSVQ